MWFFNRDNWGRTAKKNPLERDFHSDTNYREKAMIAENFSEFDQTKSESNLTVKDSLAVKDIVTIATTHAKQSYVMCSPSELTVVDYDSMNGDEIEAEFESGNWIKVPASVGGSIPRFIEFIKQINMIKK